MKTTHSIAAIAVGCSFAISCSTGLNIGKDKGGVSHSKDCPTPGSGGLHLWDNAESLAVGQERILTPFVEFIPNIFEPLPSACLKRLRLSVSEAGVFDKTQNGDYVLRVLEGAPLGEKVVLTTTYRGRKIRARFYVYDPEKSPLVGYWRQDSDACDKKSVIQELIFAADGTFSVTWEPFEAYKDFWGTYQYNAGSGELVLKTDSGNMQPLGVRGGKIEITDGVLSLGTASFGQRSEGLAECRALFR